jgi:hypothetical protein
MSPHDAGTAGPVGKEPPSPGSALPITLTGQSMLVRGEDMALLHCGYIGASGKVYVEYDRAVAAERSVASLYCHIGDFVLEQGQLVMKAIED